jgi:RNA polymerase sigma-70 factor (ECF subfamily)
MSIARATPAESPGFEALIADHRGILVKVAASYAFDPDDRADLMQEIALQLWRGWPRYDRTRPFSTWMYRVALNVAITHRRGAHPPGTHEPLGGEHEALVGHEDVDAEARDRLELVQAAMRSLSALDRALLLLWLEGCSHAESGEVLGMSEGNVATRLNRIKQHLRRETAAATGETR